MKLLLDTHALIWLFLDSPRLSQRANAAIDDPAAELIVSAVSAYEITRKYGLGKLPEVGKLAPEFSSVLAGLAATPLAVSVAHATRAGLFDVDHRDPFDRLLAAQALVEGVPIVSVDGAFDRFGVTRIW